MDVNVGFYGGPNVSRVIAHTHLPNVRGAPRYYLPSDVDLAVLDRRYLNLLAESPRALPPISRVVWGPETWQQTFFHASAAR